jgi:hypothetical protein
MNSTCSKSEASPTWHRMPGKFAIDCWRKSPTWILASRYPARGQHNLGRGVELNGVLAREPEFIALREAIVALPRDIREEAWVITQVGRGDLAILDWDDGMEAASRLTDEGILADLLGEPDLHDLLHKGLYALGAATPPEHNA